MMVRQRQDDVGESYGKGEALCIPVCDILLVKHVVKRTYFSLFIGNLHYSNIVNCRNALAVGSAHDRELYISRTVPAAKVVDVFDPFVVVR